MIIASRRRKSDEDSFGVPDELFDFEVGPYSVPEEQHYESWRRLLRLLGGKGGFRLIFAQYDDSLYRDTLASRLSYEYENSDVLRVEKDESFLEFESKVSRLTSKDFLQVIGLEDPFFINSEEWYGGFNFHRERIAGLSVKLLIWLDEFSLSVFPTMAPDMWAWQSGVIEFKRQEGKVLSYPGKTKKLGGTSESKARFLEELARNGVELSDDQSINGRKFRVLIFDTDEPIEINHLGKVPDSLSDLSMDTYALILSPFGFTYEASASLYSLLGFYPVLHMGPDELENLSRCDSFDHWVGWMTRSLHDCEPFFYPQRRSYKNISPLMNTLSPERRELLFLVSLYEEPVCIGSMAWLLSGPPLDGLTKRLRKTKANHLMREMRSFSETGLINILDERLFYTNYRYQLLELFEKQYPKSFKLANEWLAQYYSFQTSKKQPDDTTDLVPLLYSIFHYFRAGLVAEGFASVYFERLQRGGRFQLTEMIRAHSYELICLYFFEDRFEEHQSNYSDFVLQRIAYILYKTGDLQGALNHSYKFFMNIPALDWLPRNQCGLYYLGLALLEIGELDRLPMVINSFLASSSANSKYLLKVNVLRCYLSLLRGNIDDASMLYLEMKRGMNVETKERLLHDVPFLCNILFEINTEKSISELSHLAELSKISGRKSNLYFESVNRHFFMGMAHLASEDYTKALECFEVAGRKFETSPLKLDHGKTLLAMALTNLALGEYKKVRKYLEKFLGHSWDTGRVLYVVDHHLIAARLSLATNDPTQLNHWLTKAEALIDQTGYELRRPELEELKRLHAEAVGKSDSGPEA